MGNIRMLIYGQWACTLILILLCLQNAQNINILMETFLDDK